MKIKYMGTADVRRIEKSDNFNGRLAEKIGVDLEWNWENNHVIDTDDDKYSDIGDEVWELVLSEPNMKDVSDLQRIPLGEAERMWRGMHEAGNVQTAPGGVAGNANPQGGSAGITGGGGGTTTTGGSTTGDAGGSTSGGGRGGRSRGGSST